MHITSNRSVEVFIRKRTEEDAIDDAEDDCGGADAEGQCENSDSGEPRTFPPNSSRARRSASAGVRPDCASFETCFSKWKRSSSSISASTLFRRKRERKRNSRSFHTSLS